MAFKGHWFSSLVDPRNEGGRGEADGSGGGSRSLSALGNSVFYSVAASECFGQQLRMKQGVLAPEGIFSLSVTSPL